MPAVVGIPSPERGEAANHGTSTMSGNSNYVATLSGRRSNLEPILTPKTELRKQEAATDQGNSNRTACLDNVYDPQFASGGNNGRCGGSSIKERADEQLPLVSQRLRSPSGARLPEEGKLHGIHDGADGDARSAGGAIGEDEGFDAGDGESREGGRGTTLLTGCLLPMKILKDERVRTPLFVYVLISVRKACPGLLTTIILYRTCDVYSEVVWL